MQNKKPWKPWSWEDLTYPINFQYKKPDGIWNVFYTAKDSADARYRLSSFGLSAETDFTHIRIIDANGHTFFEHSKEEMNYFNEDYRSNVIEVLEPLKQFINAAPKESIETALELVTGGLASQHFTVPPDSVVELNHQVLNYLTLQEFSDCVIIRIHLINDPKDYATPAVTFWKAPGTFDEFISTFDPDVIPEAPCRPKEHGPGFAFTPYEVHNDIKGFLILLAATIVRDFWVLEERSATRSYIKRTNKTRKRVGRGKDRKLEVTKDYTFIPRFQYNLESYKVNKTIQHQTRITLSPHLVSGHIRHLPEGWERSEKAQENADQFGITLQDGQTFVMPHERGEIEQLRTYRSRSALEMLFGANQ